MRKAIQRTVLALALAVSPVVALADTVADEIRNLLAETSDIEVSPSQYASLEASVLLPRLYKMRDYQPVWSSESAASSLMAGLQQGIDQGFLPSDFHLPNLLTLREKARSGGAWEQAAFDLVATNAAVKLINYTVFGKVDPSALDSDWNFSKPIIERDTAEVLNEYVDGNAFSELLARIAIDADQYKNLIGALETYRAFDAAGGWDPVPDDTVLKPGMSDPAVAVLRRRLAAENAVKEAVVLPLVEVSQNAEELYDEALVNDMKAFQHRHGLEADGVIGPKTFLSLNRTAQERVEMIRLSLERGRWLFRDREDEFILVNIAGAQTYYSRPNGTVWTTRSITGSQYRKTPVFRDEIKYMELNPTWTVPASIFRKDKLARIRKDAGYLDRNNYLVRTQSGSVISARSVNWNVNNPGVTLVQKPGSHNALGLIKFMFPNKYAVYLHDTNDRSLFDRNERNLSSGCVRIENPFDLAVQLMGGDPDENMTRIQSILDSGKTTRIDLPKPVPVLLTYWTAWVEDGDVQFREDPYERDAAILEALNR